MDSDNTAQYLWEAEVRHQSSTFLVLTKTKNFDKAKRLALNFVGNVSGEAPEIEKLEFIGTVDASE